MDLVGQHVLNLYAMEKRIYANIEDIPNTVKFWPIASNCFVQFEQSHLPSHSYVLSPLLLRLQYHQIQ